MIGALSALPEVASAQRGGRYHGPPQWGKNRNSNPPPNNNANNNNKPTGTNSPGVNRGAKNPQSQDSNEGLDSTGHQSNTYQCVRGKLKNCNDEYAACRLNGHAATIMCGGRGNVAGSGYR